VRSATGCQVARRSRDRDFVGGGLELLHLGGRRHPPCLTALSAAVVIDTIPVSVPARISPIAAWPARPWSENPCIASSPERATSNSSKRPQRLEDGVKCGQLRRCSEGGSPSSPTSCPGFRLDVRAVPNDRVGQRRSDPDRRRPRQFAGHPNVIGGTVRSCAMRACDRHHCANRRGPHSRTVRASSPV